MTLIQYIKPCIIWPSPPINITKTTDIPLPFILFDTRAARHKRRLLWLPSCNIKSLLDSRENRVLRNGCRFKRLPRIPHYPHTQPLFTSGTHSSIPFPKCSIKSRTPTHHHHHCGLVIQNVVMFTFVCILLYGYYYCHPL